MVELAPVLSSLVRGQDKVSVTVDTSEILARQHFTPPRAAKIVFKAEKQGIATQRQGQGG